MGHSADQFAVLNDGTAGHADAKRGTKEICAKIAFSCVFAGKRQVLAHLNRDP